MPSPLTPDQNERILAWLAAGETDRHIAERIRLENQSGTGLSPWPHFNASTITTLRESLKTAVARHYSRETLQLVTEGLGERTRAAGFLANKIVDLEQVSDALREKLNELMAGGAFDFSVEDGARPRLDDNVFEGEIVGAGRFPAMPDEVGRVEKPVLDEATIIIRDKLFNRAIAVGKLQLLVVQQQTKMMEILGRLTATIDQQQPPSVANKKEKAAEIVDAIFKKAKDLGVSVDEEDDDEEDEEE